MGLCSPLRFMGLCCSSGWCSKLSGSGDVELENVSFSYPLRPEANILNGITLHLKRGTVTAVVGSSGAGKSTIVRKMEEWRDYNGWKKVGAVEDESSDEQYDQFEDRRQAFKDRGEHGGWKKVVYGGMQCGYADNYMDSTFLEAMVMNGNVVKRDTATVMVDSVGIASHVSVVALVATVWTHALNGALPASSLLLLDALVLLVGFLSLLLTIKCVFSPAFVVQIGRNFILFVSAIYVLAPVFQTLTRSISSDSIWALTVSLLVVHLFCHDYTFSTSPPSPMSASLSLGKKPKRKATTLSANVSMNASIVASVLIASRLPSHHYVFALMLFSLEFFLLFPLVTHCMRQRSINLHLGFSCMLIVFTMGLIFPLSRLAFVLFVTVIVFITLVCPYWLIRIQEYKFEINGPWDEAKLCFDLD